MDETIRPIRSMLIPLAEALAVVPGTTVAEVIPYQEPRLLGDAPAWLLGSIAWRDLEIPLVSFEGVISGTVPPHGPRARIAVFNTLSDNPVLPFWALLIQDIPRQISVDDTTITSAPDDEVEVSGILSQVLIQGERAIIPDLDYLEGLARKAALGEAAAQNDGGHETVAADAERTI